MEAGRTRDETCRRSALKSPFSKDFVVVGWWCAGRCAVGRIRKSPGQNTTSCHLVRRGIAQGRAARVILGCILLFPADMMQGWAGISFAAYCGWARTRKPVCATVTY